MEVDRITDDDEKGPLSIHTTDEGDQVLVFPEEHVVRCGISKMKVADEPNLVVGIDVLNDGGAVIPADVRRGGQFVSDARQVGLGYNALTEDPREAR